MLFLFPFPASYILYGREIRPAFEVMIETQGVWKQMCA